MPANGQVELRPVAGPAADANAAIFGELQARADELVPIGWCNQCVAEALTAVRDGKPVPVIYAGVTMVATMSHVMTPQGMQPVIIPCPACLTRHLAARATSPLLPGG
jgi:hypothetical protein